MTSKWWFWLIIGIVFAIFILPMVEGVLKSKKVAA